MEELTIYLLAVGLALALLYIWDAHRNMKEMAREWAETEAGHLEEQAESRNVLWAETKRRMAAENAVHAPASTPPQAIQD